jgi:PAS domain S-box-containing protein
MKEEGRDMADLDRGQSLRRRAEARLFPPSEVEALSPEGLRALFHELDVHQAELELQNEELRNLALELETARDRFRDLFDFAPAGYLTLETDGAILEANIKASELLGCERARLLGHRVQVFIDPASQDRFHLHQQAVLESGRPHACELRLVTQDGRPRDVTIESLLIDGAHRRTRLSLVDISDRVAAESALHDAHEELARTVVTRTAELEESRRLNERIAEAAPLLLWIFDVGKRSTLYINALARELLGDGSSERVGIEENVDRLDLDSFGRAIEQLDGGGNGDLVEVTFRIRTPEGAPRWLWSRLAAFERDSDGHLMRILGASLDVTELRASEERVRQLRNAAAISSEREHRELAVMLHDSVGQLLPLANTKLALARRTCDEATAARLAEAERLISEAHAVATSLTYRMSPLALHEIGLLAGFRALVREMRRDYELQVIVEGEAPGSRLSDALEFAVYRVVRELLVNVAKHSGAREALVRIARKGWQLSVVVEDRGVGFVTDPTRPAGWGLESAGEQLGYLGGQMYVRSEPDCGTRVELVVPLLRAGHEPEVDR